MLSSGERVSNRGRVFKGRALEQIAFPLGGIGAGSISLGGHGELRDWEVLNRPGKGNRPPYSFFLVWAKPRGEKPTTRVVEARPGPPYAGGHGYPREYGAGLPHLAEATFIGAFPFAKVQFQDPDFPLEVTLEAFSPFIPLNPEDSALPVALLRYQLKNHSHKPVEMALVGSLLNFAGYDNQGPIGISAPCYGANLNELLREENIVGLRMTTQKYPPDHPQHGSLALATAQTEGVTFQTRWSWEGWFGGLQRFWDFFSSQGRLTDDDSTDPSPDGRTDVGSLGVRMVLEPEEQAEVLFLIAWHFPNFENYWNKETQGTILHPHYAARFQDAWEVVRYVVRNLNRLEEETRRFQRVLLDSTLPDYVLDALSSQASILRTNTCQWYDDGTFHAFEGCSDRQGCCFGNCTHVWNFEQTLAFLFPQLERDMRMTDFEYGTDEEGYMHYRHVMPRAKGRPRGTPAADGQMGCLMKLYREWLLSGDKEFLQRLWPYAKRALEFAWKQWDRDKDGVMETAQHNTYDVEFYGPNTMMGTLYLGALRAAEEMAEVLGDEKAAREYHKVYEKGRKRLDQELWSREYYVQKYDESEAPKYQYGSGCLSTQLLGQWFAEVVGLGYLLPQDRVRKALQSIFHYNWRRNFYDHPNCQRIYAINDEKGLVLCSWPKGGRPAIPFPYCDEVWTGVEYQVAAHLIYEGFVEEGLAIVKGVRERHDGERRNPYDECECGHHYARALSSWSLLLALSGFHYSAPEQRMGFAPRLRPKNFRCFWSTGSGCGIFKQWVKGGSQLAKVGVIYGALDLDIFELEWVATPRVPRTVSCQAGLDEREASPGVELKGRTLRIRFPSSLHIGPGQELWVELR